MTDRSRREQKPTDGDAGPLIVGLGASAGGLKALQSFVSSVPADSGMAYVVVLHLDPDRESRMAAILQDQSEIPVRQVDGPTRAEPNHIYIVPPARDLEMRSGIIGLRERSERSQRAPIDLFFRTLAEDAGANASGVILSGTGHDGSAGIRAIREAGGITVAQSPEEADFDGMPTSAISTGCVDLVMDATEIPAELIRLRRLQPLTETADDEEVLEKELDEVFELLRGCAGHDFSKYKRATVLRRLNRRLLFNGIRSLEEYISLLRDDESECRALMQDLLISVSAFFRDPEAFDALAGIVPELFEGKGPKDKVRVWVVGSATGEEAYSLAILLAEHTETLENPPGFQIFATDIDEEGYASGRAGLYPKGALAHMEPERVDRFFTEEPEGYRISRELREAVLFALHNVLQDPPFGRMDLISCRNLFIYLRSDAQTQALENFHYALNEDGILFLGSSESVGDGTLFEPETSPEHRIFRRRATSRRVLPRLAAADPPPGRTPAEGPSDPEDEAPEDDVEPGVRLLEDAALPGLVVDHKSEVIHISEGAGRFLRMQEGEPGRRLQDLTPEHVWSSLRSALAQALENGQATVRRLDMTLDDEEHSVGVHVRPVARAGEAARVALILFDEGAGGTPPSSSTTRGGSHGGSTADLEAELKRARDDLAATRAAHDQTVAELRAANETLRSLNEEQKASGEELETGREEIQAVNEELASTNQEHQSTIEELHRTNADLKNLIQSTEIGTIFLDQELRIRRYTPPITRVFNFVERDQGRALTDITHTLKYPDLTADVKQVMETREPHEVEVETEDDEWFVVRINPYLSLEGEPGGVVLTLFDHTDYHRIQEALKKATKVAEEATRAAGSSLSELRDQFREPLDRILRSVEILQGEDELTPDREQAIERLDAAVRKIISAIEDPPDDEAEDQG